MGEAFFRSNRPNANWDEYMNSIRAQFKHEHEAGIPPDAVALFDESMFTTYFKLQGKKK